MATTATSAAGPIEQAIREKLSSTFKPSVLEIRNDSSKHQHHSAMRNNTSGETHFSVHIVSALFEGKATLQRHRLVHSTLREELEGGLHSLSLSTKTEQEVAESPSQQS
ncbi:hypothetical protein MIND_00059700 [Mycena indigotica]|uniref:BolA-like protein n=1 Tax=Mycena indigotica TaxID=2126181 RepID=A0A8H6TBG3_9AGAR|nr:uncharacterized protein MIND_00059700 [Mycena indigotica]KAF7315448.1 hypothetical protein MIND_00059700 [Mycena indigotica]